MSVYTVEWGTTDPAGGKEQVRSVEELDAVLDRVQSLRSVDGLPFRVSILAEGQYEQGLPVGVQASLGHPERASLLYLGPEGSGLAVEPGLSTWTGDPLDFDFGGVPTEEDAERLTLTPGRARVAIREYVATGHRPGCVEWAG